MKLYAVVAGVAVLVVLLYTDHVEVSRHDIAAIWGAFFSRCQRCRCRQADFAHASLLIDLLKVVLVTTYMTLQTLCMGECRPITSVTLAACAVQSFQ